MLQVSKYYAMLCRVSDLRLHSSGSSEQGLVASFCEHGNKPSGTTQGRKYLSKHIFIYILKKWCVSELIATGFPLSRIQFPTFLHCTRFGYSVLFWISWKIIPFWRFINLQLYDCPTIAILAVCGRGASFGRPRKGWWQTHFLCTGRHHLHPLLWTTRW